MYTSCAPQLDADSSAHSRRNPTLISTSITKCSLSTGERIQIAGKALAAQVDSVHIERSSGDGAAADCSGPVSYVHAAIHSQVARCVNTIGKAVLKLQ